MNTHSIDLIRYCAKSRGNSTIYLGTAGSHGNEQLQVTQGKGWEGLTVQVVFHPCKVAVQLPANGVLDVPWEATARPLTALQGRIVFQGFDQDRLVNSTDLAYSVASHSPTLGRDEEPYTPGIVEGVLNQMAADKDAILQAAQQTGQAKEAAAASAAAAASSAANAQQSAGAANTSAGQAAASASQAAGSAAAANETLTQVQTAGQEAQQKVKDAETEALGNIAAAAPALPAVSAAAAWQSVTVKPDGSGYNLAAMAPIEATIRPTVTGNPAVCEDSAAWAFQGLAIYGKSTQDGEPSPENPVPIVSAGDGGSISSLISGINIVNTNNEDGWRSSGDTVFSVKNGTIIVSGSEAYSNANILIDVKRFAGLDLYIKADYSGNGAIAQIIIHTLDGTKYYNKKNNPIRIPTNVNYATFGVYANDTSSVIQNTFEYQNVGVYIGKIPDIWQPYKGPQNFSISTPNGLPGIPVESGGTFTDADGQQWICDVVDLGNKTRNNYIKSCTVTEDLIVTFRTYTNASVATYNTKIVYDETDFKLRIIPAICNKFVYSKKDPSLLNPGEFTCRTTNDSDWAGCARISFGVPTSISSKEEFMDYVGNDLMALFVYDIGEITSLSPEELAAYRALTTYDGTTVVSTAEPVAGIEARYVMDGNKYRESVDKRLAALEAAQTGI